MTPREDPMRMTQEKFESKMPDLLDEQEKQDIEL